MQITEHFSLEEMTHTDSGIKNELPGYLFPNIKRICDKLEEVRALAGGPLVISSGYRCDELERYVGGKLGVAHNIGCAADFHPHPSTGLTCKRLFDLLIDSGIKWDQLILETLDGKNFWLHIGVDLKMRQQAMTYDGKKYELV